ncbi:50S ribosomal protein L10 [Candidatus Parvarchaeota archaeon]|nr:50S ribosomal protein L10 [Candidatus Parvarchaeota archaeon]
MKISKGSILKKKEAEELAGKIKKRKTVCIIEISSFPSNNFEQIRKILRGKAEFIYTNKIVIYNALKPLYGELAKKVLEVSMPILMLTDLSPFDVAITALQNKAYSKIKAGETANEDIVLPSGPTPFPPGPMLSQFSSIGVKTKNEGGKISIVSDTTVVKKGERVNEKVASILSSMDIRPKEIVLSIPYASVDNVIFQRNVLYKSKEEYLTEIAGIFKSAVSISFSAGIINKFTVNELVKKVYIGVRFLSLSRNIVSASTISDIIAKASLNVGALSNKIGGK